jgi:hypothetical protein
LGPEGHREEESMSAGDDAHDDCIPREDYEELQEEVELYRQALEDAGQLLDWSLGYLYGIGKRGVARALSRGRQQIRTSLLGRDEQVTPADVAPADQTDADQADADPAVLRPVAG